MSSFGFMSKYRTGYYLAVRSFLLRERKTIPDRIAVINAELRRIGLVRIDYGSVSNDDGSVTVNENRQKFNVSPNSSLEKLIRAYIAQGGNPLDISMFLIPDLNTQVNTEDGTSILTKQSQPYGGVVYPLSQSYHATNDGPDSYNVEEQKVQESGAALTAGDYPGGYLNLIKYPPRRLGRRKDPDEDSTLFAAEMHNMRKWANAEIRYKLHDLEARIIKLCDLREQLQNELDLVLMQAWGGIMPGLIEKWSTRAYVPDRRVAETMLEVDQRLFIFADEYEPAGGQLIPKTAAVNLQGWFYIDDPSEDLLDLMA